MEKAAPTTRVNRWSQAASRTFHGLTLETEGPESPSSREDFTFIQLADPQLGMMFEDTRWAEEARQLECAVEVGWVYM